MLAEGEIRVHVFELGPGEGAGAGLLDEAERAQASRFVFARDRERYVRAHVALRATLGAELGLDPRVLRFRRGPHGRPELVDHPLRFSLSHAQDLALVALARNAVGVDVEPLRAPDLDVARYFSRAEQLELERLPARERSEALLRGWVRKEAFLKARGTGLTAPLDGFDVTLGAQEPPRLLATRPDASEAACFFLANVPLPRGHLAALCHEGAIARVKVSFSA